MINYSTCMLANPAKPEEKPLAYARAQTSEVMSFRDFGQHIANHGGYSRGKVNGVISDMCACLVEMLLEGKKVQLGDLGDFWLTLNSKGAESAEAFNASMITGINIIFTPGPDFDGMLGKANFVPVSSRAAQAATLKAEKKGEKTVDLEAAKKKGETAKDDSGDSQEGNAGGDNMG
ncbi:MAG TPA: DNA-binding protein [Prevotellaceae bacterium]|nr:DNA-binding protein [Prevotellaceae bacterium]HBE54504.1 DNA-binding protein [Prevotellaceae bacterium]